jgi:tetratricopeptide (TPR) repeat protein
MTFLRSLFPALLLAACGTHSAIEQSNAFARLDDQQHAFEVLDDARNAQLANGYVEPDLEAAWSDGKKRFLFWRARQSIFQEREESALRDLAELKTLDANYPGLVSLQARADRKRAHRACLRGEEALLRKDYAASLEHFIEAQRIVPDTAAAVEGIDRVKQATDTLSLRAQQQFLEAVRKVPEFRTIEVQWHAANVLHNDPDRTDARELQGKARRENAEHMLQRGRACEQQQQFGAALMEYRAAQRMDPSLPGIETMIVQMEAEMVAAADIDRAKMAMRSEQFADARVYLGKAFEKSVLMRNDIGLLQEENRRLEGKAKHQAARNLATLGKKAEALAAFEALAKDWPQGLDDEQARIASLKADVEGAKQAWADAEAAAAAGDKKKALEHYEDVERFYAGWKDAKARIQKLRKEIGG